MQFVSFIFVASMASTFATERGIQALANKWIIAPDPSFAYGGLAFDLDYQVSDFIRNDMTAYALYTSPGCKETGAPVPATFLTSILHVLTGQAYNETNNGDGVRDQKLTVNVNPVTIAASDIYAEETTDGFVTATIDFCVRFSLQVYHDGLTEEVNYLETLVTLFIDLSDGFVIGDVNVVPNIKIQNTANQDYFLEGYQCDLANDALTTGTNLTDSRSQGSVIRVCVKPNTEAVAAGIKMRSLDEFTFSRNSGIRQSAIIGYNLEATNGLTSLTCSNGVDVCVFETMLFAAFYSTTGVVFGSGTGSMQFGTRRLRALPQADRTEVAATSEFNLAFGILNSKVLEEGLGPAPHGPGTATTAAMSAISLSIAGAFLFYLCRWTAILRQ
jgi:hypothetical protein